MKLAECGIEDPAVLAVVKNGDEIESVTVFYPYSEEKPKWWRNNEWYASRFHSIYGDVDICYSWRASYKMMDRIDSGFHTGTPLPGELFAVMSRKQAISEAEKIYFANGGKR